MKQNREIREIFSKISNSISSDSLSDWIAPLSYRLAVQIVVRIDVWSCLGKGKDRDSNSGIRHALVVRIIDGLAEVWELFFNLSELFGNLRSEKCN